VAAENAGMMVINALTDARTLDEPCTLQLRHAFPAICSSSVQGAPGVCSVLLPTAISYHPMSRLQPAVKWWQEEPAVCSHQAS
jgi:hypothetical protein